MIDAHHHLWDLRAVQYPWLMRPERRFFGDPAPIASDYPVAAFRADHAGEQVEASVHIQVGAADPLQETRWLATEAARSGWRLAIVAAADLRASDLESVLDAQAEAAGGRLRGVRQIVARHPSEDGDRPGALLRDPAFARGLRVLAARGLGFDLQLVPGLLAEAAGVMAEAGVRIALCHAGSPWDAGPVAMRDWRRGLAAMAAMPGACAKLSGLGMLRPDGSGVAAIADGLLEAFGAGRVMWGSNVPVDALARPWAALLAEARATIPAAAAEDVFAGTARRFYAP